MGGVHEERFEVLVYITRELALDRREWKITIHMSEL
jgi:hypothetical protein